MHGHAQKTYRQVPPVAQYCDVVQLLELHQPLAKVSHMGTLWVLCLCGPKCGVCMVCVFVCTCVAEVMSHIQVHIHHANLSAWHMWVLCLCGPKCGVCMVCVFVCTWVADVVSHIQVHIHLANKKHARVSHTHSIHTFVAQDTYNRHGHAETHTYRQVPPLASCS